MGRASIYVILQCLVCGSVFAKIAAPRKAIYPVQRLSARGIESVEIIGVKGQLKLRGSSKTNSYRLLVRHSETLATDDWNLLVERRGKVLVLEVSNISVGHRWEKAVRAGGAPEFDIELEGPAKPARISWRTGRLHFDDWRAPAESSVLDAVITSQGGAERFDVQATHGDVSLKNFRGEFRFQGEGGRLNVERADGKGTINWLHGEIALEDFDGTLTLSTEDARVATARGRGAWEIEAERSQIQLREFAGSLKGKGASANWAIDRSSLARGHGDLELMSGSGAVQLEDHAHGQIFLTSAKGKIRSPFTLHDRDGTPVAESARQKNADQIFVRTQSGNITFKY